MEKRGAIDEVLQACDLIAECGVRQISLADTVGLAAPDQIEEVVGAVVEQFDGTLRSECTCMRARLMPPLAFAPHSTPGAGDSMRRSAASAGVLLRRMCWSAIFPPEILLAELRRCGANLPAIESLDSLIQAGNEISSRFGLTVQ